MPSEEVSASMASTESGSAFSENNHYKSPVLSRQKIENMIAQGRAIIIYDSLVLDLTSWLSRHPGGDVAIFHLIGRDATDEMNAYHCDETVLTFSRRKVGRIDYIWENMLPPIQGGVFEQPPDAKMYKPLGKAAVEVERKFTPEVIVSLDKQQKLFPVVDVSNQTIVDPQVLMNNYDNTLTKHDVVTLPALDYETQKTLSEKYRELHQKVLDAGFYQCRYVEYFKEFVRIGSSLLYAASFFKLGYYKTSALFLGFAWQQLPFIVHDAGHIAITHNYQFDNLLGIFLADFIGGLSIGWWKRNHNVHHIIPNDPVHDPDIQHLPFFAVSVKLFNNVYSTYYEKYLWFDWFAKKLIPFQNYMYYPLLCFGRFNLYRLSWTHLLLGQGPREGKAAMFRYYEILGLGLFFYWFFYLVITKSLDNWSDRIVYIIISHFTTAMVHVQITLSHFAMSTSDLGCSESFVSRQLRTTMDVDCPEWFDYFHGGLQFQAIHHLFPRMPRHNFRRAQPMVIDFCKEVGLQYHIYGFGKGNEVVISKLREIGKQAIIMVNATKAMKQEAIEERQK
ncbi:hypothetical protein BABINDRAFT_159837 [Babjeviella inositovora NRRL Y-12698]|uniref:Delta 8-(E)-sphingolipid desaturase n=1 Tax=Babjeviella inositovora NRRL Y-12698 TaxID=984486 RepID=A0A1E3QWW2_9ASCO|nr:uncharacterized protein BABINDRAFT_159837 [Babjeviella inositovora NRRL Y-12698]ODQ81562.1 hypothetical protein BABINDRAFT_159837 [Babjeviella inositovora NRRL Y-12698]